MRTSRVLFDSYRKSFGGNRITRYAFENYSTFILPKETSFLNEYQAIYER
jgi:hypothetical protein